MKTTPELVQAMRANADAGWDGQFSVSEDADGHVHVRWNGRHVEGVSVEACAEYIRRDAAAKEAEMNALDDANILGPRLAAGDFDDD